VTDVRGGGGVARVSINIKGRCIHVSFKEGESKKGAQTVSRMMR
jgi:hypothetical protein